MSTFKKVTNIISWVIIIILIVLIIFVLAAKANNKVPKVFGYGMLKLISGSMEPTYMTDEYILIQSVDEDQLKVGDVIAFYSRDPHIYDRINTHRIVEIDEETGEMVTKGDANSNPDSTTVTFDRVVGRVVTGLPVMTFLGKWLSKTWVIVIIVSLAVGWFVGQSVYNYYQSKKMHAADTAGTVEDLEMYMQNSDNDCQDENINEEKPPEPSEGEDN